VDGASCPFAAAPCQCRVALPPRFSVGTLTFDDHPVLCRGCVSPRAVQSRIGSPREQEMKRARKKHSSGFKAKVALAAIKGATSAERKSVRRSGTESSQTPCWREMDSNFRYRGTKAVNSGHCGVSRCSDHRCLRQHRASGTVFSPPLLDQRPEGGSGFKRSVPQWSDAGTRVYATLEVARTRAENALTLTAAMISPVDRATGTASDRSPTSNSSSMIA
jgi:hypothetical protein